MNEGEAETDPVRAGEQRARHVRGKRRGSRSQGATGNAKKVRHAARAEGPGEGGGE